MQAMIKGIQEFLYDWHFAPDGLWREVNPQYQPFKASSHKGLIALLRISVPAIGTERSARVSEALRQAGYRVIHFQDGSCAVQRDTRPRKAVA